MEKEKINKAAQLADDLKKVNRALNCFKPEMEENVQSVAVRVSTRHGHGKEDMKFAYLPEFLIPDIYRLLSFAKDYIIKEMEAL